MSKVSKLLLSFSLVLTFTGCASIQKSEMPESQFSSLSCPAIADQLRQAQATREDAVQAKRGSWKVIIPFAIGVRYFNASNVEKEAEKREAHLIEQQQAKGCAPVTAAANSIASIDQKKK